MKRQSGILMHISSLYGDYSIGNFGKSAYEFIDFIREAGFSVWQVLPFTVTDEYNSPYKSFSAFGGNPYFIDPETLCENGLISASDLENCKQTTPYACEFERLGKERLALLRKAYSNITDKSEIDKFIDDNPRLEAFCRFMTLREQNGGKPWQKWKSDEITDTETLGLWKFIQYEFFRQWYAVKDYANSKGISIIGDIPIYVSDDSCDVWENRRLFQVNEKGYPSQVAGVPPDYFAEDGQLWGNPLYDWDELKKDGYGWWKERIDHALKMFDGVRIDHFRAVEAYWSVDAEEKTARNGKWVKGPGIELVNAIKEGHEDKLIIAEDLGDITDEVRALVEESGFPGMRVFQFGFLDDGNSIHMPHNYIRNSVAYSGTHDNNTLFGFLWESDDAVRRRALDYCGFTGGDWGGATPLLLRAVFSSVSDLAIIPVQDFLMYGSDTRINTPGVASGNWSYRVTKEQLKNADIGFFKSLNRIYRR
ncbi:MAG: 4-alpha-glucanotransferase [Acutalibacteraceae bacterium]|nr:4-alpha-glucanotransferase [Acutalibacteraceae bacterium]